MNYMIHAAPAREWYVREFLIPSMRAQGIREREITIWMDREGKGNLKSCLESFRDCGRHRGGTWHLQDDVILCRDFAARTKANDEGMVCGFYCRNFGPIPEAGRVPARFMWYSFQCIRIPDALAGEFADWAETDAVYRPQYQGLAREGKGDDSFFRDFILERHRDLWLTNLAPNLVDHIDYLIGGTLVNHARIIQINRSSCWEDENLVRELEEALKARNA